MKSSAGRRPRFNSHLSPDADCEEVAFGHLYLSVRYRAISIPARMFVVFLHELDPMKRHAWMVDKVGERCFTFDATEQGICGKRIVLADGREAANVAKATTPGKITM